MPLEGTIAPVAERVRELNARYRHHSATEVLRDSLTDPLVGPVALVSSFGSESVVLLHMLAIANPDAPVLFIDTQLLFPETLEYQRDVAEKLGLTNIQVIGPNEAERQLEDPDNTLHQFDTDACCALRKTRPLQQAIAPYGAWFTGRKRFQGGQRAELQFFENEDDHRIKINPLAHWAPENVREYMDNNNLPRHPLVARGYPSIGCAPCTSPVAPGEDPRAGRWRGQEKTECGIHIVDGKIVRTPLQAVDRRPF